MISGTMFASFDAGGGPLPFSGNSDLFVVSLDPSASHLWSAGFGSAGSEFFAGNSVDAAGDVLLWGPSGSGVSWRLCCSTADAARGARRGTERAQRIA